MRNMSQIKEQTKTPEKLLNKIETNTLLDAEFKTMLKRMLKQLGENLHSTKKDVEIIKRTTQK